MSHLLPPAPACPGWAYGLSLAILLVPVTISPKLVLVTLLLILMSTIAAGQGATSGPQVAVEMEYCGVRPGKPPLKFLSFNITVRNLADKPQWFLFPRALYEKAPAQPERSGVDGVEIFSKQPERSVSVAQFMGSVRLQPESAGGFQALLLPAGAVISIHDFSIRFWGDNFSPLPLRIVIASQVSLGKTPADRWAGERLLSSKEADVNTRQMRMVRSKFTRRRSEIAVSIEKSGEVTVPDALAKSCSEGSH
jgi:hypothetical protein